MGTVTQLIQRRAVVQYAMPRFSRVAGVRWSLNPRRHPNVLSRAPGETIGSRARKSATRISLFWEAMIVHAAVELGLNVLWSEEVNDGQFIRGVRIRDPFARKERPGHEVR